VAIRLARAGMLDVMVRAVPSAMLPVDV